MSGHVDGPRAVSDLNEQAVEAAAAKIKRFGWPYVENATAVVKQMIPAYFDSLAEQGIVLVEQPTKCRGCSELVGQSHQPGCPYEHNGRGLVDHAQTRIDPV